MFARLKILLFLIHVLIYFSGCGFSGNEDVYTGSSSSSSSTSTDDTSNDDTSNDDTSGDDTSSDNDSTSSDTESTATAIDSWGSAGTGSGQYMGQGSIIADSNYIYISSVNGSGISKFDTSGNTIAHNSAYRIRQISFHPSDTSKIYGYAWATSATPATTVQEVKVFDLNLNEIASDNSSINGIFGLTVDTNGNVYVSGPNNNYQVSKYSDNGTLGLSLVTSWGSLGTSSGQFSNPQYVHIYNSLLYVADNALNSLNGNKVVVYDLSGSLQKTISMSTYGTSYVTNICFDNSTLYVVTLVGPPYKIVKISLSDNSVYEATTIKDESGSTIFNSSGHCAIMSSYLYLLFDGSSKKIYKFNLSDF